MKIEVLGTRGKIKPTHPKYHNHTGFLIDEKILLDVGEPDFLNRNPEAIVFTHFHPDHAFFVSSGDVFDSELPHHGPEEHELLPNLEIVTSDLIINGYKFIPIPVIHALRLKSFGYLVEKENKRVLFTGDVAWIEEVHLEGLGKLDLVITEATFINKGGRINRRGNQIFGHTGVPDLIRMLSPHTQRIIFTHFGEWFYEDVKKGPERIKALEKEGVELIPAKDNLIVKV